MPFLGVLQKGQDLQIAIPSSGPLHLLFPLPGKIYPARLAFLPTSSLCLNVTFSWGLTWLSYFKLSSSYSLFTLPHFIFSTALTTIWHGIYILLNSFVHPSAERAEVTFVQFQILKHCLDMVRMKWIYADKLADGIKEWKRFLSFNKLCYIILDQQKQRYSW